jgi:hypothetical protein
MLVGATDRKRRRSVVWPDYPFTVKKKTVADRHLCKYISTISKSRQWPLDYNVEWK